MTSYFAELAFNGQSWYTTPRAGLTPDEAPWQVKIHGPSSTTKNPISFKYDSARKARPKSSLKKARRAHAKFTILEEKIWS